MPLSRILPIILHTFINSIFNIVVYFTYVQDRAFSYSQNDHPQWLARGFPQTRLPYQQCLDYLVMNEFHDGNCIRKRERRVRDFEKGALTTLRMTSKSRLLSIHYYYFKTYYYYYDCNPESSGRIPTVKIEFL